MQPDELKAIRKSLPGPFSRQPAFAALIGRSVTMLSHYENGKAPAGIPAGIASFAFVLDELVGTMPAPDLLLLLNGATGAGEAASPEA